MWTSGIVALCVVYCSASIASKESIPKTIRWNGNELANVRTILQANGSAAQPFLEAVRELRSNADSLLDQGPWTVVNNSIVPPSGDPHDYISLGSYWWPCTAECNTSLFANCTLWKHSDLGPPGPPYANCSKSTGLPWYDHDGYHNPVCDGDGPALHSMGEAASTLALAGYLLGMPVYSQRAALILRTWFVEPETAMNPNGNYAQGIPGRNTGRGIGIIDFDTAIPEALDASLLLAASDDTTWSASDTATTTAWASAWLSWLIGSKNGKDEASATNNHGSWYDSHAVAIAALLKQSAFHQRVSLAGDAVDPVAVMTKICSEAPTKRIDKQVSPDGELPMEDRRTKSEAYHAFDTEALLGLADLCLRFAPDTPNLFAYTGPDGRGLGKVMTWLAPYANSTTGEKWPFNQIEAFDRSTYESIFRKAARVAAWSNNAPKYAAISAMQPDASASLDVLTFPFLPSALAARSPQEPAHKAFTGPVVIVYGSTPGGIMSAVAASRTFRDHVNANGTVVLVDPARRIGGMCAGGLGSSDIGNATVIGGLAHEFFMRVAQTYSDNATSPQYYLEPSVAEQVFRDMLTDAGVIHVSGHGHVASVHASSTDVSRRIDSILLQDGTVVSGIGIGKDALRDLRHSENAVFIDASYEGDLMARAGVSFTFGREANTTYNESAAGRREPWGTGTPTTSRPGGNYADVNPYDTTSSSRLLQFVTDRLAAPLGSGDDKVQAYNFRLCVTKNRSNAVPFPKPSGYNRSDWQVLFRLGKTPTGDRLDRYLNGWGHPLPNGKWDMNNGGVVSTDFVGGSWEYPNANYTRRAELYDQHVRYQQGLLYTLAHDEAIHPEVRAAVSAYGLCKDEFVSNSNWPEQLYVREARRMIGDIVFTQNDVLALPQYGVNSIGMGSYNFDAHYSHTGPCKPTPSRDGCTMYTRVPRPGEEVWLGGEGFAADNHDIYQFPLSLLLPRRSEATNFVNPVTPSTTHVSFATVRMEPQFMILGHSAGAVAALTAAAATAVHDVNTTTLHAVLRASGQILDLRPGPP
eukprot:m.384547 g.384547  ORF g.384547 m.384547 type:complete len:1033 (+) comp20995_c1_seq4:135-3233(+)